MHKDKRNEEIKSKIASGIWNDTYKNRGEEEDESELGSFLFAESLRRVCGNESTPDVSPLQHKPI